MIKEMVKRYKHDIQVTTRAYELARHGYLQQMKIDKITDDALDMLKKIKEKAEQDLERLLFIELKNVDNTNLDVVFNLLSDLGIKTLGELKAFIEYKDKILKELL